MFSFLFTLGELKKPLIMVIPLLTCKYIYFSTNRKRWICFVNILMNPRIDFYARKWLASLWSLLPIIVIHLLPDGPPLSIVRQENLKLTHSLHLLLFIRINVLLTLRRVELLALVGGQSMELGIGESWGPVRGIRDLEMHKGLDW